MVISGAGEGRKWIKCLNAWLQLQRNSQPKSHALYINKGSKADSFLINVFFNWTINALQNCVGFCQTSIWSVIGTYWSPPFWTFLPPTSLPFYLCRLLQSPTLSFLSHTANSHWLSILHMVMRVAMLLSPCIPPSPSSPPFISVFGVPVSPLLPCT